MVSLTKGKHSLFIGGEFALDKTMFDANLLNFGSLSFATSAPTSTGNVTSDWVTGQASATEQDSPYTDASEHMALRGVCSGRLPDHALDLRPTLESGGIIDTPPVDAHNRTESFIPGQQSTVAPARAQGHRVPG